MVGKALKGMLQIIKRHYIGNKAFGVNHAAGNQVNGFGKFRARARYAAVQLNLFQYQAVNVHTDLRFNGVANHYYFAAGLNRFNAHIQRFGSADCFKHNVEAAFGVLQHLLYAFRAALIVAFRMTTLQKAWNVYSIRSLYSSVHVMKIPPFLRKGRCMVDGLHL